MASENDITKDKIKTKPTTVDYRDGWERIFRQKKKEHAQRLAQMGQRRKKRPRSKESFK